MRASSRRNEKARIKALLVAAREQGDISTRATCIEAHEVHVLRLAAGHDETRSEEAEAGALLKGYYQAEAQGVNLMLQSLMEALNKSGK